MFRTTKSVFILLPDGPALLALNLKLKAHLLAACSWTFSDTSLETTARVSYLHCTTRFSDSQLLIELNWFYRKRHWSDCPRQHFCPTAWEWRHLLRVLPRLARQIPGQVTQAQQPIRLPRRQTRNRRPHQVKSFLINYKIDKEVI